MTWFVVGYLQKPIVPGVKRMLMLFQNFVLSYRYEEKISSLTEYVEDIQGSKNQAADERIKGLQKKIDSLESELKTATTG